LDQNRLEREARVGFWPERTTADYLDDALEARPDSQYLTAYRSGVAEPDSLTFADLSSRADRIARNLRRLGVDRGDVVSFQIPNWWQFIGVHMACVRIGAVSNPLLTIYREREVEFMVMRSGSKVLIVPDEFRGFEHAGLAAHVNNRVPSLDHVVVIGSDGEDSFDAMLLRAGEPAVGAESSLKPNDVMKHMFTSGTTGEPKGVMHTSNTMLSTLAPVTARLNLTADDVIFMPSPFAHSIGFCYGIMMSLFLGARLITMDVWDAAKAADIMERQGATFMFGATPFLADLAHLPGIERRDLRAFKTFLTAGAPVPPALVDQAVKALDASIVPGFGMTELGLVSSVQPSALDRGLETDGVALPYAELRVVDAQRRELAPGTDGELQCRGSSMFIGYRGRPDLYEIDENGWFSTGDRARLDSDGYIRIVGRNKDIIIRGGENIPVVEVENLIHEMVEVDNVAIVGMPDVRLGERSCAFVSLRGGQTLTLERLTEFLSSKNLARQYMPEKLIVIDGLPMTPAGKVQKFKLREQAAQANEVGEDR